MADFNEQLPDWLGAGIEPPTSKKNEGWQVDDKPPAAWWNWLLNRTYKVLLEIRSVFSVHKADTTAHLTAAERTTWNAKETTTGAQAKADSAKTAAITTAATDATTKANAAAASSIPLTQKGAVGGVAPLDSGSKISEIYLPDSIVGQVEYKGTWNATTNTPTLPTSATANKGWYYVVATAGTYSSIDFQVGDWVISNGVTWQKVDNTDAVSTVFGRMGNVVAAANDYTWAQINKATSSFADITTRSAGDLTSGTLPIARLPAITGDITMAAGTNTTAITAGVIVNADVSAAAGIDASKIGTGVVSNAEFAYLDGVTSAIQAQLNNRPLLTTTPQQTTSDITYYVRTDGNDANAGTADTAGGAFKTIAKAISMVPKIINHTVSIVIGAGIFAEKMLLKGFGGSGTLNVSGVTSPSVQTIEVFGCTTVVTVSGFTCNLASDAAVSVTSSNAAVINQITSTVSATGQPGIVLNLAMARITGCAISNRGRVVSGVNGAKAYIENMSGAGNVYCYVAELGAQLSYAGSQPTSTNGNVVLSGGMVNSEVLNPWGDNNGDSRTYVECYTTSHGIVANVAKKITFTEVSDMLNEFSNSTFTAKQRGRYMVSVSLVADGFSLDAVLDLYIYVNGGQRRVIRSANRITSQSVIAVIPIFLFANEWLEIYVGATSAGSMGSGDGGRSFLIIQREG